MALARARARAQAGGSLARQKAAAASEPGKQAAATCSRTQSAHLSAGPGRARSSRAESIWPGDDSRRMDPGAPDGDSSSPPGRRLIRRRAAINWTCELGGGGGGQRKGWQIFVVARLANQIARGRRRPELLILAPTHRHWPRALQPGEQLQSRQRGFKLASWRTCKSQIRAAKTQFVS